MGDVSSISYKSTNKEKHLEKLDKEIHSQMMGGGLQIGSMPGESTSALIRLARRGGNEW